MSQDSEPSFGDHVRIRSAAATEAAGWAGREGLVCGFTTPSSTGVHVIGSLLEDYALAVMFEEPDGGHAWFARDLVEFLDHAAGTEIRVADVRAVRKSDGSWEETMSDGSPISSLATGKKRWWQLRRRG